MVLLVIGASHFLLLLRNYSYPIGRGLSSLTRNLLNSDPTSRLTPPAIIRVITRRLSTPHLTLYTTLNTLSLILYLISRIGRGHPSHYTMTRASGSRHGQRDTCGSRRRHRPQKRQNRGNIGGNFRILLSSLFFRVFSTIIYRLSLLFRR